MIVQRDTAQELLEAINALETWRGALDEEEGILLGSIQPLIGHYASLTKAQASLQATLRALERKEALAIRWILAATKSRSNKEFHTFDQKLTKELMEAANNSGAAIKKKDDVQKVAQSNRAFSHFRW